MILLLLSAAQGPSECCLAVSLASKRLLQEAKEKKVEISLVEEEVGLESNSFKSMLFKLEDKLEGKLAGKEAIELAKRWNGTMQWICQSPFRPKHKRKNWFFTGSYTSFENQRGDAVVSDKALRFEACRSSGPGGQHANKTSSAIRATHIATGISVKVESERSQHANKRLAKALIERKITAQLESKQESEKSERRLQHHSIERGNAIRIFKGIDFIEQ